MNDLEILTKKRIKAVKIWATLMIVYCAGALVFFALNALHVIDILGIAEYETERLIQTSTIGTCVLGIVAGILCLATASKPTWYGIVNVFCVCTVVFSAFIQTSHVSASDNFAGFLIMMGCTLFACICATYVNKLRKSRTDI